MKNKRNGLKKILSMVLIVIMTLSLSGGVENGSSNNTSVNAATITTSSTSSTKNYITVKNFIIRLVKAMDLTVDTSKSNPYIQAAYDAGILEQGDFSSYSDKITRTDCAVLLNRADEYLHKNSTVDSDLLDTIISKRISDIKKIDKSKREAVASVYAKGIIKGYSNGTGTQDREFRGSNYVTVGTAKSFIKLTVSKKNRAEISSDGQLIRTTNLPSNYKKYDYILDSFPNSFYEQKFDFQLYSSWKTTLKSKEYNLWVYPVHMKNDTYSNLITSYTMQSRMNLYLDQWVSSVETYCDCVFNADYRTIGSKWRKSMLEACAPVNGKTVDDYVSEYITSMKKYKAVIKSSIISVEPSTLYRSIGGLYIRVYVKFKMTATSLPDDISDILFCGDLNETEIKLNKWYTSYYDISLTTSNGYSGDGSDIGVMVHCNLQ